MTQKLFDAKTEEFFCFFNALICDVSWVLVCDEYTLLTFYKFDFSNFSLNFSVSFVAVTFKDFYILSSHLLVQSKHYEKWACEIYSKLTIKTSERRHRRRSNILIVSFGVFWCFYCELWTSFTPSSSFSIVEFEQLNVSGAHIAVFLLTFQ